MQGERGRFPPKDAINTAEWNIRVLPTLRLSELGIDLSSDILCLGDKRLILAVEKNPVSHERVYLGLPQDPRRGEHLLLVLNTVAPVKDEDVQEVHDHWVMPRAAREHPNSSDVKYSTTHSQDPFIAPAYGEFARDHVDLWAPQLFDRSNARFKQVFRFLTDSKAVFVDDKKAFGEGAYQELLSIPERRLSQDMPYMVIDYKNSKPLLQFLREKASYRAHKTEEDVIRAFMNEGWNCDILIKEFLEELPQEEQAAFGFYYSSHRRLLLDLETQETAARVFDRYALLGTGRFLDPQTVQIQALDLNRQPVGEKIGVRPGARTGPGERACVFFDVPTPTRFTKEGLYPLFAWRNKNGRRSFLTQEEADRIRATIPVMSKVQADVMLGRLELIPLHPEIKEGLPEELALRGTHPRPIRATSVGTLASVAFLPPLREGEPIRKGPATLMLTDENGILAKLEKHAARLAA